MGRIVVTEYISVDGIVEAPSGTESFERVGWTDDFSRGPEGDKFNTMPKYVVSKTLTNPEWNNTTVLSGDLVEEVTKLKQRFEGDIVVHGSPQLAQALIEHDLVDALHLQVYPVIVGAGKRLFSETSTTKRLRLAEARTVGDVHLLNYERAND